MKPFIYLRSLFFVGMFALACSIQLRAEGVSQVGAIEVVRPSSESETLRGRLYLYVSTNATAEPRIDGSKSLFAQDVLSWKPGSSVVMDSEAVGSPELKLSDLPEGDYYVQALFNRYTEFKRADGHIIWAHMDQWEGQNFARSPGNTYSQVEHIHVSKKSANSVQLILSHTIAPIEIPEDTKWVKRIKFESPLISKFWGHPMYLGATILLPKGYDEHPNQHYPVVYVQNHFSIGAPFGFRDPASQDPLKKEVKNQDIKRSFSEYWLSEHFPRVILVTFQHPTPYFDDSYAVNSPNCGPYGDAIMQELIPRIESQFRVISEPYARTLTGSSTGGWESLALQIYHPDFFNGAWAFSPDPLDFRLYYGGVNIYKDDYAFIERNEKGFVGGGLMNRNGSQRARVIAMQDSRFEWWKHTTYDEHGYPQNVWDLTTGKVDHQVAEKMRENGYDLRDYLARNWSKIGDKLNGKFYICAAYTDSFYSNLAVHLFEEYLSSTTNPHNVASFHYGPEGSHHGWQPMSNDELIRMMAKHVKESAPVNAQTAGWYAN
jgi:S-formylglutathione hydrolase FrmB